MSQNFLSPNEKFIHKWFFKAHNYSAHIKHFICFLYPLVEEHVVIYFWPIAQARTACTEMFCLRAPCLGVEEKINKVLIVFLGGICFLKITYEQISNDMMNFSRHLMRVYIFFFFDMYQYFLRTRPVLDKKAHTCYIGRQKFFLLVSSDYSFIKKSLLGSFIG